MPRGFTNEFYFSVPFVRGKERARRGAGGHFYTPAQTRCAQFSIAKAALAAFDANDKSGQLWGPYAGPVSLSIVVEHKRNRKLKEHRGHLPLLKPDFDNVGKLVADALVHGVEQDVNGARVRRAMIRDDKQVAWSTFDRVWGTENCIRCYVRFMPLACSDAEVVALERGLFRLVWGTWETYWVDRQGGAE